MNGDKSPAQCFFPFFILFSAPFRPFQPNPTRRHRWCINVLKRTRSPFTSILFILSGKTGNCPHFSSFAHCSVRNAGIDKPFVISGTVIQRQVIFRRSALTSPERLNATVLTCEGLKNGVNIPGEASEI